MAIGMCEEFYKELETLVGAGGVGSMSSVDLQMFCFLKRIEVKVDEILKGIKNEKSGK